MFQNARPACRRRPTGPSRNRIFDETPGRLGGFILLPHLGVAAFVEHRCDGDDVAVGLQHIPPPAHVPQQAADRFLDFAAQAALFDQPGSGGGQGDIPRSGSFVHRPQRRFADTAAGNIDDPLKRQVVRRLDCSAHIGDGISDFGAFIEPQAANDTIGHTDRDQPLLKCARLEASTH